MRALTFAVVLCCACGPADEGEEEDDDFIGPPDVPACQERPRVTFACRDAGLVLPDGTVTGIECNLDVADDSWPEGCAELERNQRQVAYCCPR